MSVVKFVKTTEVKKGKSLLHAAKKNDIKIKAPCKGKGKCGKCVVRILSGQANPPTKNEEKALGEKKLKAGYRLACEITETDNLEIEWPEKAK